MSSLYLVCNRGKRSIAVDLQTPGGVDIVRRLAADADVLIQNFRPGVMDKLGLGYDAVRVINPDVVYVSLSGFGATGPYRDPQRVRHRDPGLRRPRREPIRSRRRHPGVPAPDRRRQGDGAVRVAGDQRRAVRGGAGQRRSARRALDDGRRRVVPVGRLRGERGAARSRRIAALELRRRFPADALRGRLGHRDADFRSRLRRDVPRTRRRRLRRPARRDDRRAHGEPRGDGRDRRGATSTPRAAAWPTRACASRPSVSRSR